MSEQPPRDTAGAIDVGAGHYLRWNPEGDDVLLWSHPGCRGWHPLTHHLFRFGPNEEPEGITIYGSLLCWDTGVHGWITNGRWRDA